MVGHRVEVAPGAAATYSVLVATPDGAALSPLASWAFCATPKLLTEDGVVSPACYGAGVRSIAEGPSEDPTDVTARPLNGAVAQRNAATGHSEPALQA